MSVFTGGPYGRLAVMLNTLSSLNKEIIIIIIMPVHARLVWIYTQSVNACRWDWVRCHKERKTLRVHSNCMSLIQDIKVALSETLTKTK